MAFDFHGTSSVNIDTGVLHNRELTVIAGRIFLCLYTADSVHCGDTKYKRILCYNNALHGGGVISQSNNTHIIFN